MILTLASRGGAISNAYRISNDIYNGWRSIWRITNQVVPFYRHTTVGAYADMDMLMWVPHHLHVSLQMSLSLLLIKRRCHIQMHAQCKVLEEL